MYLICVDVFVCVKERVEELQKYVEILKAEKQQLELMGRASRDSFSSLLSSPTGNIRRVGLFIGSAHISLRYTHHS